MTNTQVGFWQTEEETWILAVQLRNGNTVLIDIEEDKKRELENAGVGQIDPL